MTNLKATQTDEQKIATNYAMMFGMSPAEMMEHYGPESFNVRMSGSNEMLVASILSDCQEMLERDLPKNSIREYLNRSKWILFKQHEAKREAERLAQQEQDLAVEWEVRADTIDGGSFMSRIVKATCEADALAKAAPLLKQALSSRAAKWSVRLY